MEWLDATRRGRRGGGTFSQKLKRDPGRALAEAEDIIRLAPDNANGWSLKGMALLEMARHDEALHSFDQAIRLRPDMAEAWQGKGASLVGLRRYEEALSSLAKAPHVYLACYEKGRALESLGRHNEAMDALEEAIKLNHDDRPVLDSSRSLLESLRRRREAPEPAGSGAAEPKAGEARAGGPRAAEPKPGGRAAAETKAVEPTVARAPDNASPYTYNSPP